MLKRWLPALALVVAASTFGQRIVSPAVDSDGRVTFRLSALGATNVELRCEGLKPSALQKDEKGIWSLTVGPLEPDIYAYSFLVDGVRTIDPANHLIKYNLVNIDSEVHVPGPPSLPWEIADVPRGELHRCFYHSRIADDDRDFIVYTPPGYNPAARKRYPVLYLLHGYTDETHAWTLVGRANVILDNLIARKQARPMIVVMPLGYGTMAVLKGGGGDRNAQWQTNLWLFRDTLLNEVMPRAEKEFRILPGAESHAIAGLSMGGAESLLVGLNATDRFSWIGAFSAGGLSTNYVSQFPALDKKAGDRLRLLWISCGKQDHLRDPNQRFCDWLDSKGVRHQWIQTEGEHSFRVWRRNLANFAPLLFQKNK